MPTQGQNQSGNRSGSQQGQGGRGPSPGSSERGGTDERGRKSGEGGFSAMDDEELRELAQRGGKAVSEDRDHMSDIGRKGGEASGGQNRGDQERGGGNQGGNQGGRS